MTKKLGIILASCVFALCLGLMGCTGGDGNGGNDAANKEAFVGTWDLVEMSQDGEVTGSDDLETLKALGLEVYVNFYDDGSMVLALFGEPMEGTWEATSATAGTIEMEGQSVSMSIENEQLKFEQEGASLTFEKGEAKEAPTASSTEDESTEATDEAVVEDVEEAESSEAAEAESESTEAAAEAEAESSSSSAAA